MRIVVALGGNALLRRGEPLSADNQRENVRAACTQIARIAPGNELVVAHGNGPQVGLLALQGAAYSDVPAYPLDVLGAETEGMIGYIIEQELGNLLPFEVPFATLLTQVEVDAADPAFEHPSKPIGPVYSREEAERLAREKGWSIAADGDRFRRVVPSPRPKRIFEIRPIRWLLEKGSVVICAGGGGIPTVYDQDGQLHGIEAVIDKDLCSALLAEQLEADLLVIATDVDGAYLDWGTPEQRRIGEAHPDQLERLGFAAGSMGPKVQAACEFARNTGKVAVIGSLGDIEAIAQGRAGTRVSLAAESSLT
ncbi:carbamate kinase [Stutzerimonas azotifigens]|uniref:Carbamate kinase n=1 Tax=Stutzerimonas azotifigens TaxID=291995 RepID=A0ABR5Z0D6_9GAMM|nr:carbamate kinase [Stutzerimonas azotifigens]MBA1273695.1 carbamate kinase [Stutzerimonas azotifigens]